MTSQEIQEKIEELKKVKEKLEFIEKKHTTDLNELIYIKYIFFESVTKVAEFLNEAGFRYNNRKYVQNDISSVLMQKGIIEDLWLDETAKRIFKKNKSAVNRRYN